MTLIVRSKKHNSFRSFYLSTVFLLFSCSISTYARSLPPQSVSPGVAAQSAIVSKTELVLLPVNVTDANGNSISGLSLRTSACTKTDNCKKSRRSKREIFQ